MLKANVNNKFNFTVEAEEVGKGLKVNNETYKPTEIKSNDGLIHFLDNNKHYKVELITFDKESKKAVFLVNHNKYEIELEDKYDSLLKQLGMDAGSTTKVKDIKAPMPGLVLSVNVNVGDEVAKDDPILVLEAMKMENIIKSPAEGIVKSIEVETSVPVEKNQVLIEFE